MKLHIVGIYGAHISCITEVHIHVHKMVLRESPCAINASMHTAQKHIVVKFTIVCHSLAMN